MAFVRPKCCKINNNFRKNVKLPRSFKTQRHSRGFSLIEVLVSMLVLAIGIIGTAGLQLAAARTTQQSALQTTALELASEMSDKIRANDLSSGKRADNPFLSVDYNSATQGEPAAPNKLCFGFDCSDGDLAAFDIYEWEKRVKNELPGGRARICRDARPWNEATRSLAWECTPAIGKEKASLVIKLGWRGKNPDGSPAKNGDMEFAPTVAVTVMPYVE